MKFLPLSPMRWLNSLLTRLRASSGQKHHSKIVERELEAHDLVSRFIYSTSAFSRLNNRAKPNAFSPEPHPKLSVLHSSNLTDGEIWQFGQRTLGTQRGRDKIHGRADLSVKKLIAQKLKAIRDDDPFERHTSIVGWPKSQDPDQQKADIKAICLELSQDPDIRVTLPQKPITRDSTTYC